MLSAAHVFVYAPTQQTMYGVQAVHFHTHLCDARPVYLYGVPTVLLHRQLIYGAGHVMSAMIDQVQRPRNKLLQKRSV